MTCRKILDQLPLFVGGDLSPPAAARVGEHLSVCGSCAAEQARFEAARRSLFVLKGEATGPAPDLWPSIRSRISAPPRRRPAPWLALAGTVAVLALAILSVGLPGTGATHSSGDPASRPPEITAARPAAPDRPAGSRDFLLHEVTVAGASADYEAAPGMSTIEPGRGGWDEF